MFHAAIERIDSSKANAVGTPQEFGGLERSAFVCESRFAATRCVRVKEGEILHAPKFKEGEILGDA
jgi:hypothetical protein